jgi:predicted O-linked N-acetylglucosamine transferase (SPINDLY family)
LAPTYAHAHYNLGIALKDKSQFAEAATCFQQALTLNPNLVEAHHNLGNVLNKLEQLEEAITCYQRALALKPNYVEVHNNLGTVLNKQDQSAAAIACYQRALALNPNFVDAHHNLGNVFLKQNRFPEAVTCYQRALALKPDYLEVHINLGSALMEMGNFAEALASFHRALTLDPNHAEAYNNLGIAFWKQGQLTEAIAHFQQALTLKPNDVTAHTNLSIPLRDKGMIEEAIAHLQRALEIDPTYAEAYSSLLLTLNYAGNGDSATLFSESQKFNQQCVIPLTTSSIKLHSNTPNPQRRLKIGYVSGDFRKHSVAYFIEPILAHHDHHHFEIFCYYNATERDDITARLQQYSDHWLTCISFSDDLLANQIRQDQIDILIDLSGHTAKHRLLLFARKPAPIQVAYLGYPTTTGLTTIDYRISDEYVDAQGVNEQFSSETPVKLPASFFCYQPYNDSPPVSDLPALQNNYITFSSFNNLVKLNSEILSLWAKVLNSLPDSKLLIKTRNLSDLTTRQYLEARLVNCGITLNKLIFEEISPAPAYLSSYHQVDIALDSFPFNGGLTTCEALWMGIPVVTLVGERHVSRLGLSILSTIGLTELIAHTKEEYVNICIKLANNLNYLQELRAGMRQRLQTSPLMDAPSFTRHLEDAYRQMWGRWCEGRRN